MSDFWAAKIGLAKFPNHAVPRDAAICVNIVHSAKPRGGQNLARTPRR
jgi:hypothetical protein